MPKLPSNDSFCSNELNDIFFCEKQCLSAEKQPGQICFLRFTFMLQILDLTCCSVGYEADKASAGGLISWNRFQESLGIMFGFSSNIDISKVKKGQETPRFVLRSVSFPFFCLIVVAIAKDLPL